MPIFAFGVLRLDAPSVDRALALVVGLPAERPLPVLLLCPPERRAGGHVELRHLVLVEVRPNGLLRLGAETTDRREHLVLLDEPDRLRDDLCQVVGVVVDDELHLATPTAACFVRSALRRVLIAEVRAQTARDGGIAGCGARKRERPADLDHLRRDARYGLGAAECARQPEDERARDSHEHECCLPHVSLLCVVPSPTV